MIASCLCYLLLPAAPFPRPLRYRPCVLKRRVPSSGPALAGAPRGLGRRALRGRPHDRLILDPRGPGLAGDLVAAPPHPPHAGGLEASGRSSYSVWRLPGRGGASPSPPPLAPPAERAPGPESLLGGLGGGLVPLGEGECPNSPWTGGPSGLRGLGGLKT